MQPMVSAWATTARAPSFSPGSRASSDPRRVTASSTGSRDSSSPSSCTTASVRPAGLGVRRSRSSRSTSAGTSISGNGGTAAPYRRAARRAQPRAVVPPPPAGRPPGQRLRRGEQQVDEPLDGGLGLVVGQARPLVGLDEHAVGAVGAGHDHVQPRHRDADGAGRRHRRGRQVGVEGPGDVVDRAAGVEVGGAAHDQLLALGQDVVEAASRRLDGAGRLAVERDGRLAAGRRRPPPALRLDQAPDRVPARADDRGGAPHGGRRPRRR